MLALTQTYPNSRKRLVEVNDNQVTLIGTGTTFMYSHFFDVNRISDEISKEGISIEDAILIIEDVKSAYENHFDGGGFSVAIVKQAVAEIGFLKSKMD
ncbi:hypothetical protein AKG60_09425 [Vibrio parahaemolyticus]|uniref:Uncharacterized protein n=1 Tax=Vibrio parahaemolyticus TaxID=670 RepID=A0AAX0MDW1_VIBPH|nr:hypothetical protein [Vibrio parahaemolyticus]MCS0330986.1 hypothetical protein [Vibrio diabolicus]EGQ8892102.1 hypothetical protein [Vibrio parahaemolyticus]EGR3309159.1 hypothetical protein [Vibrio parahaemolyticus]EJG0024008.1 hypothetical protein [Vibrio parahaemolyticus]